MLVYYCVEITLTRQLSNVLPRRHSYILLKESHIISDTGNLQANPDPRNLRVAQKQVEVDPPHGSQASGMAHDEQQCYLWKTCGVLYSSRLKMQSS